MPKTWWQKWVFRPARAAARRADQRKFRPRLERLEEIVTPAITLGPISLTPPGPITEGSSSTLSGTYTATNIIGALQLQITSSAPFSTSPTGTPVTTANISLSPSQTSFSIPLTFVDNPATNPVNVSAILVDTGPGQIGTGADGGNYRAFTVPFMTNVNLGTSLSTVGAASGVQQLLLPNATTHNQSLAVSLLGNSFRLYGRDAGTQIGINENGLVTLQGLAPANANNNGSLSSLPTTIQAIAPLWTDLALTPAGRVLARFVDIDGNLGNGSEYLVIEWNNISHVVGTGLSASTGTFQVFLQLNTGAADGDVIFNYIDTDFGHPPSNFGANATVGIKDLSTTGNRVTQIANNPGQGAAITGSLSDNHAIRISSNTINVPSPFGSTDPFGYRGFRMPFDSKLDLAAVPVPPATVPPVNGQSTNRILTGTFNNASGFQFGAQSLSSTITVGATPIANNNTFNFYGVTYSNLQVSKNGFISLSAAPPATGTEANGSLAANPPPSTIAPLWDNWNGSVALNSQLLGRFIEYDGDGRPEYLVINWKNVENGAIPAAATNNATFQAVLQLNTGTEVGAIWYNYQDTDVGNNNANGGAGATVGVKDVNPTNGRFLNIYNQTGGNPVPDLASARALGVFPTGSASQSTSIIVTNVPPVISANPTDPLSVNEGATFTRTINVADPGRLDTFTGTVSWGDGTANSPIIVAAGGTSFVISHIYGDDRPGGYTVTVTLTDKDGGVATPLTFVVTVINVAPTVTIPPPTDILLSPGEQLILDGTANRLLGRFTDPGFTVPSAGTVESFVVTVDWGDGSTDDTINLNPPPSVPASNPLGGTATNGSPGVLTMGTLTGRHTFNGEGVFTVTVTVTDDNGGVGTATFRVSIGSPNIFAAAPDAGGLPIVQVFDTRPSFGRQQTLTIVAYDTRFRGGVHVATGDVNGDGLADIVTGPGRTGGPHVRVFDGSTGAIITEFFAYDPRFSGGVFVAVGDINGDGTGDVITGAGPGGAPHVRVFDIVRGNVPIFDSFTYGFGFGGGVSVASGDVNGDGRDDIITGAGQGGGPHVLAFSGMNGSIITSLFAYDTRFRGGVFVASGDINGDGRDDIVTGPGLGGGPHARVFDGISTGLIAEGLSFPPEITPGAPAPGLSVPSPIWASGLRVAASDLDEDGVDDILIGPGPGRPPVILAIRANGPRLIKLETLVTNVANASFLGGVFIGAN